MPAHKSTSSHRRPTQHFSPSGADIDDLERAHLQLILFFFLFFLSCLFFSRGSSSPLRDRVQPVSVCGWFSLPRNLTRNLLTSKVIRRCSHRPPPPSPTSLPSAAVSHWPFSTHKGFVPHGSRAKIPRGIVSFETDVTDRVSLPLLYRRHSSP